MRTRERCEENLGMKKTDDKEVNERNGKKSENEVNEEETNGRK